MGVIIWLLLLLFIGALYVLIKGNIIKPEYGNSIFAIGCLVGLVFYGITDIKGCEKESANKWVLSKMLSAPKCDRDSAEKFAVKRMMGEIISGPHLKSENDDCTFTFNARIETEPKWTPQGNRVFILGMEITVGKRKGKWEVLDVESWNIDDY